jgi:hypothetical protein
MTRQGSEYARQAEYRQRLDDGACEHPSSGMDRTCFLRRAGASTDA